MKTPEHAFYSQAVERLERMAKNHRIVFDDSITQDPTHGPPFLASVREARAQIARDVPDGRDLLERLERYRAIEEILS